MLTFATGTNGKTSTYYKQINISICFVWTEVPKQYYEDYGHTNAVDV